MTSIADYVGQALNPPTVERIGQRIGTDAPTTSRAVDVSVPVLLEAIARNASSRRGARELHDALRRDHDGSMLDDLGGYLSGDGGPAGEAILRHVLGGNRGHVEQALGGRLGLSQANTGKLLTLLAPILLGVLGKWLKNRNLNPRDMQRDMRRESPGSGGGLGDILNDVLGKGRDGQGNSMAPGCLSLLGGLGRGR